MIETAKRLGLTLAFFALFAKVCGYLSFLYNGIAYFGFIYLSLFLSWKLVTYYRKHCVRKVTIYPNGKAVFITGCDSGFGHKLAISLDTLGMTVFAGCLLPEGDGAKALSKACSDKLKIVKIDVTNDQDVYDAADFVENNLGHEKLWSVINNAGIIDYNGVDLGKRGIETYTRQMDVNTFGSVRVTKAFLPLVRKTKGARIVLVGSVAGRYIAPALCGYAMTKYALRAFAEGLRREMKTFGIHVSVIEPVFYKTAVSDKDLALRQLESNWAQTPEPVRAEYGEPRFRVLYKIIDLFTSTAHRRVQDVVEAITEAVTVIPEPEAYYRVCSGMERFISCVEDFPEELIDCVSNETVGTILLKAIRWYNNLFDI